jgi:hypothetical protein
MKYEKWVAKLGYATAVLAAHTEHGSGARKLSAVGFGGAVIAQTASTIFALGGIALIVTGAYALPVALLCGVLATDAH